MEDSMAKDGEDLTKHETNNKTKIASVSLSLVDESGLGEELAENISSVTSIGDNLDVNQSLSHNHGDGNSLTGASENSFNFGALRKDDSGVFSEKSPNWAYAKELSDGEFSESISESLDETNIAEVKGAGTSDVINIDLIETSVNNQNNAINSKKLTDENKLDENCDSADVSMKVCDDGTELSDTEIVIPDSSSRNIDGKLNKDDEEDMLESNIDSAPMSCDTNLSEDKNLDIDCDSTKFCETDDTSQNEDETWAKFMKKAGKVKSSAKRLVDYEESDSEEGSGDAPVRVHVRRNYRKRRSGTDSDDDGDDSGNKDNEEEDNEAAGDGTPVLLKHTALEESNLVVNLSEPDLDSDDDEDDEDPFSLRKTSDSEAEDEEVDDTPPDFTKFGPPKHKWRALYDLREREMGYSNYCNISEPGHFRKRVHGSLQMVQRFDLQFKMDHHEGCVNALHFNSTGTLLASGSDDLNIVIWNWIRNRPALVYDSGHRSNVFQAKFMPFSGDCHVVSCARDGQIRLADLSLTGVCKGTKKIAQHRGAAHKLALENDSAHIVLSCGEDAVTYQIDVREDKPNKLVTTKENDKKVAMYSIHSNPVNSHEFCVGGRDHFIRVYDKRKINEDVDDGLLKKFAPHHIVSVEKNSMKANITCACYNYNGTEILGTYNDEDIYLFSNEHSDSADYIHRYCGHRNNQTVKGVNFYGPESEYVVSGSDCGHVFLWDKATENIVQYMKADEGGVINVLEPHPFAPVLATSGLDHDIKIWAPTAESPTKLKGLRKITKQNERDREEERTSDAGMIDGSMLWFIMHQLRRGRRRREREARAARGEEDGDVSSDTLSDDESSPTDNSDSDAEPQERIQCNPS